MGKTRHRLFVGTYTKASSRGIYSVELDAITGTLGAPELAGEATNPTFLALSPNQRFLYAVCAGPGWLSSFSVDPGTLRLAPVHRNAPDAGPAPCHVAVDRSGRIALAANFHLAQAAAIPLWPDGTVGTPRIVVHTGKGTHPTKQLGPHVHSANFSPDNVFAVVCDLGLDKIFTYRIDPEAVALFPGTPPFLATSPASGPRHLAFDMSGRHAYAINELDNTVVAYDFDAFNGGLAARQVVSVLPPGFSGNASAAEVCLHPNGRFLYASCRGSDTLAVFVVDPVSGALALVEVVPCGGKGPRSFAISHDGAWIVCANQDSNSLTALQVDGGSGRLKQAAGSAPVSMPVCALFVD